MKQIGAIVNFKKPTTQELLVAQWLVVEEFCVRCRLGPFRAGKGGGIDCIPADSLTWDLKSMVFGGVLFGIPFSALHEFAPATLLCTTKTNGKRVLVLKPDAKRGEPTPLSFAALTLCLLDSPSVRP